MVTTDDRPLRPGKLYKMATVCTPCAAAVKDAYEYTVEIASCNCADRNIFVLLLALFAVLSRGRLSDGKW